jgi:phosphatidylserine/phosphatidylglycerophosphate/cardiolipin synthase-like enzyme
MTLKVKVYDNGDHTCIAWLPSDVSPISGCRGFTIRRVLNGQEGYLHGFVGFTESDVIDPAAPWKFPLQRFMWWDYAVKPGDLVQYSVIPVVGSDKDHLALSSEDASALTDPMTITGQATAHVSAYFNKGVVAAQWVSKALASEPKGTKILNLIATPGDALRDALSGLLRPQLLSLLAEVKEQGGEIYAALYELKDPELIAGLSALGKKCHLILANGAFKPPTNDENAEVREALSDVVDLHDRLVTSGHYAHNKFVVFCDSDGHPLRVLTGSTNWTETGLCTQANNAVIVEDPDVAGDFLAEWNLLEQAGNAYPESLAEANSNPHVYELDGAKITQWFAPTTEGQDLVYARQLIDAAKEGILFLFFNPGVFVGPDEPATKWTLLQNILVRHHPDSPSYDPKLYIRGVVNQEILNLTTLPPAAEQPEQPAVLEDPSTPTPVTLFTGANAASLSHDVMVPANIKSAFSNWAAELLGSGVHVHSKVIVLDPFGEKPVVMTGSHNLGYKASTKNDDNLMIIEGNAPLAAAFAVNIIGIFDSYRWNAYVEKHRQDPKAWHGLVDTDGWQASYLTGPDLAEARFWMGEPPTT